MYALAEEVLGRSTLASKSHLGGSMYPSPPSVFSQITANLPLLLVNIREYAKCFGPLQFQFIIQYFSHFLKIENGYSGNILRKKSAMKLCRALLFLFQVFRSFSCL